MTCSRNGRGPECNTVSVLWVHVGTQAWGPSMVLGAAGNSPGAHPRQLHPSLASLLHTSPPRYP
jgi:hypothetical protein